MAQVYLHPYHGISLFYIESNGRIQNYANLKKFLINQNRVPPEARVEQFSDRLEIETDLDGQFPSPSIVSGARVVLEQLPRPGLIDRSWAWLTGSLLPRKRQLTLGSVRLLSTQSGHMNLP
jgi:hypothetical protein